MVFVGVTGRGGNWRGTGVVGDLRKPSGGSEER